MAKNQKEYTIFEKIDYYKKRADSKKATKHQRIYARNRYFELKSKVDDRFLKLLDEQEKKHLPEGIDLETYFLIDKLDTKTKNREEARTKAYNSKISWWRSLLHGKTRDFKNEMFKDNYYHSKSLGISHEEAMERAENATIEHARLFNERYLDKKKLRLNRKTKKQLKKRGFKND